MQDDSTASETEETDSEGSSSTHEARLAPLRTVGGSRSECKGKPAAHGWRSVLAGLSFRTPPVRVLLPCAGWDAPCQALQALRIPYTVAGAWETDMSCAPVLRKVHGIKPGRDLPSQFHLGRAGDVTRVPLRSLPDADALISGPPCPPFSTIGKRGLFSDPRANVLMVVIDWILHLADGSLRMFVVENVMGILRRMKKRGGQSPADEIINKLKRKLRHWWHIECIVMDSGSTAQRRKRVYIAGYRRVGSECSPLQTALPQLPQQTLADIISRDVPNTPLSALSAKQRSNLHKYKLGLEKEFQDKKLRGQIVAMEIDRDPDKKWGASVNRHGRSMCLRRGHDRVFLMSLGEGSPKLQRLLTPEEAAALQGMRPELLPKDFSRRRIFQGLGNAMTVPVVGQVLYVVLKRALGVPSGTEEEHSTEASGDEGSDSDDISMGIGGTSSEDMSSRSSDDDTSTGSSSR